ncbi:MAG: winged helix-turn-helix domain-containing protein [Thermoplasmata archaeon]
MDETKGNEAGEADPSEEVPDVEGFPRFLTALLDEVNVRIMKATAKDFLTVREIAEACGLGVRACYRKVRALLNEGLLCPKPDDSDSRGRPSNRYKSTLGDVYVVLSGSDYTVKLVWPTLSLDLSVVFP